VTSLKKLQQMLDTSFEQNFRPEADQIDHLRKMQSSETYRRQSKAFRKRKTMATQDFSSFKLCARLGRDDSDLSDDEGGATPNETNLSALEDDYFSGALSSFSAGCQPTAEESKLANISNPSFS